MRIRRSAKAIEEVQINLTPLIDVVFVVLIMFIVVAPLLEVDRVELAQAGSKEHQVQENSPLTLHVYEDNSISLNSKKIHLAELKAQLDQAHKCYPGVRPQLFQDRRAQFGTFQEVKNAIEGAGFQELDVILKP